MLSNYPNFSDHEIEIMEITEGRGYMNARFESSPLHSLYKRIHSSTQFLNNLPKVPLKGRVYCILNNLIEVPPCPICSNPIKELRYNGFLKFCSSKCRDSISHKLTKEQAAKLNDANWIITKRIDERMSYEDIGKLIGVSGGHVAEVCKKIGIHGFRYNQSKPFAKAKLEDYDYLYNAYKVERKTGNQIADEIGSSNSTVSIALRKHKIEINPANSYDRPFIKISKWHWAIYEYITKELGIPAFNNNRTILDGIEIDIIIPDYNLGIECNGLWHHRYIPQEDNPSVRKDSKWHIGKTTKSAEKGIQLLQFWDSQWTDTPNIVKNIIASKLGKTNTIHGRKCKIIEVPAGIKNNFLDENHIQGSDKSSIRYGLEYEGELVAVMTFNKSRYNKHYDWELCRYASKNFNTIVGGFSKLLTHFRKHHLGSIISYSDILWSRGDAYRNNGFTLLRRNPPGYHYIKNGDTLLHRSNFRKDKITFKGDTRTEEEIMMEKGYNRVWDCGQDVWVIEK